MSIPERIAAARFVTDAESHISVAPDAVRATGSARLLIAVCPAGVYAPAPEGGVTVDHAACLECGTCLAVAPPGVLRWHYPRGGMGVAYREG